MNCPVPLSIPGGLPANRVQGHFQDRGKGQSLQQNMAACYLYTSFYPKLAASFSVASFQAYMDNLLEETGGTRDPVERMMVEQLALAYHNIGRLHMEAAHAATPEQAEVLNSAAARLLGEFRRLALALREYRTPTTAPKQLTMIGQQNVAKGHQQIAYVEGKSPAASLENSHDTELECKPAKAIPYEHPHDLIPQSAPRGGREAELVETRAPHPRRPRAVAAGGNGQPTLAALDGPEDA